MINVDWFQPYKHINYSVGAIYIVILNLPRHLRYKRENVLLVGIMPGPCESKHDINSYLTPLVNELLLFLDGVNIHVHGFGTQKLVKCVLLCASCDVPAGRKTCGFLGHSAKFGCSRCMKCFEGTVGQMDYGGFNRDTWLPRSVHAHREMIHPLLNCRTKAERQKLESESGFRYTVLLRLPYFDTSRMLAIDPMHNLFLGSAKHVLKHIWIDKGIISTESYELIQNHIDLCKVPSDIGRIPHKIFSGFSSFTADQFKNWILYFFYNRIERISSG